MHQYSANVQTQNCKTTLQKPTPGIQQHANLSLIECAGHLVQDPSLIECAGHLGQDRPEVQLRQDPAAWLAYEGKWGSTVEAPALQEWFARAEHPVSRSWLAQVSCFSKVD